MLGMCLFTVRDNKDEHLNPEDKNVEDGSFDYRYDPIGMCTHATTSSHQPHSPSHRPHRTTPPCNLGTTVPHSLLNYFSHLPPPASFPLPVLYQRKHFLPKTPGENQAARMLLRSPFRLSPGGPVQAELGLWPQRPRTQLSPGAEQP